MAGWDDVSAPVSLPQEPAASPAPTGGGWDAVSTSVAGMPDMSGVRAMATKNMQEPEEKGEGGEKPSQPQEKPFSAKLDQALGIPISSWLGNGKAQVNLTPDMRGHLMDSYAKGTSTDFSDFMHSVLHAVAPIAAGMEKGISAAGRIGKAALEGIGEGYQGADVPAPEDPYSIGQTIISGVINTPYRALSSVMGGVTGALYQTGEEISKGAGRDLALIPQAYLPEMPHVANEVLQPHPELRALIGQKLDKPATEVTGNDIAQAIRMMGQESKALPPAKADFDNAAAAIAPEPHQAAATALQDTYKDIGISPDQVFADAQKDPAIAEDIKTGKVPETYQVVYHGTPHNFNEFSTDKIGTGEGATAYGHGLYFTTNKDIAEEYRTRLTQPNGDDSRDIASRILDSPGIKGDYDKAIAEVESRKDSAPDKNPDSDFQKSMDEVRDILRNKENLKGNIYNVRIPSDDSMLHWDKPLDEQPEAVQKALSGLEFNKKASTGAAIYDSISAKNPITRTMKWGDVQTPSSENASRVLDQAGITGIKYSADMQKGARGEKGYNYVVFNDKNAKMVKDEIENNQIPIPSKEELTPEHQQLQDKFGTPETMTASQLGKLDKKLSQEFSEQAKNPIYSDPQYDALEQYAKRVELARDRDPTIPPGKQIKSILTDQSGAFTIPDTAKEFMGDIKRDVLNFATPMETGSDRARAAAKDFANKQRWAQWNGARIMNMLQERYTPEELKGMWDAMDKASVHAQTLESNGISRDEAMLQTERDGIGHFALPEDQRETVKALSEWAQSAWDRAKKLEMVEGEGLPFWTPRMAAVIGEDGTWRAPDTGKPSVAVGHNLRTSTGSLKQRKYLTAEETEAAMKEAFGGEEGEGAKLVRDIRAMPLALTRLEQAIGGRALINEVKQMGNDTGAETVTQSARDGYFTIDHPAFYKYQPRLKMNDDTGKWEVQKDADGNDLFDKRPIYIAKEFEGPLKAVLSQDSSAAYKALMELKGKSMGLIMYSPVIHNAVEWGRALPAMPGKVATFKIYFEGNRVKNDPVQMQEAINAGLVPIGSRFFHQDINSIIEQPNLTPGRSWTAKLLGGLVGEVNEKAGESVKSAIDKMGDIWHNTLLWDRVGDLQAGLYANIRDQAIKDGMDPRSAAVLGAHIANRFAGALPMESMGNMARKMANVAMFSRSFTVGNLGVMKDMVAGLPSDVMAQLKRDVGEQGAKTASAAARRKAIAAFALDIGLMYAGNSLAQDMADHLKRDKSLSQIGQGYVDRFHKLLQQHGGSPWELLNLPADLRELSSTSTNEPGKQDRILWDKDPKTGTASYLRLPTGKIGEEFLGWATSPLEMARKKGSQLVQPLMDIYRNEDYFGHPIYDKNAQGITGAAESVGKAVEHIMSGQVPGDMVNLAYKTLTGQSVSKLDVQKAALPIAGITVSKGYPGGPEAGILAAAKRRQEAEISQALPKIKEAVESGDEQKAQDIMESLSIPTKERALLIRHYREPQNAVNARTLRRFEEIATPEEKELLEEQQGENH